MNFKWNVIRKFETQRRKFDWKIEHACHWQYKDEKSVRTKGKTNNWIEIIKWKIQGTIIQSANNGCKNLENGGIKHATQNYSLRNSLKRKKKQQRNFHENYWFNK